MLSGLVCGIRGHKVDRNRVWHDNLNYRTTCRSCGASLLRDGEGWRVFNNAKDFDSDRRPHPHFNKAKTKRFKSLVG